jgi:hypothetical protein
MRNNRPLPTLPFIVKNKLPKSNQKRDQQRERRKISMTLVSALSGFGSVVLLADTEESVYGVSKRAVDKLRVYSFDNHPFRFAISGCTTHAEYLEMLQTEIASVLLALKEAP